MSKYRWNYNRKVSLNELDEKWSKNFSSYNSLIHLPRHANNAVYQTILFHLLPLRCMEL